LEKSATAGFVGLLNRAVVPMSTGNVKRCSGFRTTYTTSRRASETNQDGRHKGGYPSLSKLTLCTLMLDEWRNR